MVELECNKIRINNEATRGKKSQYPHICQNLNFIQNDSFNIISVGEPEPGLFRGSGAGKRNL